MHVLCVFVLLLHTAVCQLVFRSEQKSQRLELTCEMNNFQFYNFSYVSSLVIYESNNAGRQPLASVSANQQGSGNPVSHLPDAQILGHVSIGGSSQQYLQILWTYPSSDIDGDYMCEVYGVDSNYLPVQLTQKLSLQIKTTGPRLIATPKVIRNGLTEILDINCSVPDPAALNVSKMASLEIRKINNGVEELLSEIKVGSQANLHSRSDGALVNGSLNDHGAYLGMSWANPTADHSGEYICEGSGISTKGMPIFFDRHANVSWEDPDVKELVQRLHELYNQTKESALLREESERSLQNALTTIDRLNRSFCPKACDDLLLGVGEHIIDVEPDDGIGPITVLCEARTPNEIWTVFQKRFNGSVDFNRNYSSYEDGFGSLDGEFWLGLANFRRLLLQNGDKNQLRVDMTEMTSGINHTRVYPVFSLGPAPDYRLNVSGLNDHGRGMSHNSGMTFSTYDYGAKNYAVLRAAGWWLSDTGYVNLNGVWGVTGKTSSIIWYEFQSNANDVLSMTEMKFRRND